MTRAYGSSSLRLASAPFEVLGVQEQDGIPLHHIPSEHPTIESYSQQPLSGSCYTNEALIVALTPYEDESILEIRTLYLSSRSANPSPHHILFPAPLLPDVHLKQGDEEGVIILQACTTTGYVYRFHLNLSSLRSVESIPSRWFVEQRLTAVSSDAHSVMRDNILCSVHCSADGQIMLVVCADGRVAKLAWVQGDDLNSVDGHWRESVLRPSSFFGRLFGRAGGGGASGVPLRVLSVATFERSTSWTGTLAFTVSQDRRLRVWDLGSDACIRTIDLPRSLVRSASSTSERDLSLADSNDLEGRDDYVTATSRSTLIRTLSTTTEDATSPYAMYLIIFVPTSTTSGPFLACYGIQLEAISSSSSRQFAGSVGDIDLLWERRCDADVSGSDVELRDMRIVARQGCWEVWCVWDASGKTSVRSTRVGDLTRMSDGNEDERWTTVSLPSLHSPLHGIALDEDLESLTDVEDLSPALLERITEPDRFSIASLDKAVKAYERVLLARNEDPARLPPTVSSHFNIREQIVGLVGCTITLDEDPSTGGLMHDKHFAALKREWAIFLSLLSQFDIQERWPIAFTQEPSSALSSELTTPFVVSRGWLSLPIQEEPLSRAFRIGRESERSTPHDTLNAFVNFGATLKQAIEPLALRKFESSLMELLVSQPSAVVEDAADQLWSEMILPSLREEQQHLNEHFALLEEDARISLETFLVMFFQPQQKVDGKHEHYAELFAALVSDGLTQFTADRLALARLLMLVALALRNGYLEDETDELQGIPASDMVARCIIAFHRLTALNDAAHFDGVMEIAISEPKMDESAPDADIVAIRIEQMQFAASEDINGERSESSSAAANLVHKNVLLAQHRPSRQSNQWSLAVTGAAENSLNAIVNGDAQDRAVELTLSALKFADFALLHGHPSAALDFVKHFPLTLASDYVMARCQIALGDPAEAALSFEKVLAAFDHWEDERSSSGCGLLAVLPVFVREAQSSREAAFQFCRLAVSHFKRARALPQIAQFARLAISLSISSASEAHPRTRELHLALFRCCIEMEMFEDAYVHLLAIPFDDLQRESLRTLISIMCEQGCVEQLLAFNFAGLQAEVERTLSFKARNSNPLGESHVNYYDILYAFHVARGDLKSAGATMWQLGSRVNESYRKSAAAARKTSGNNGTLVGQESEDVELVIVEARCYLASVNALSLIDAKDAWFAHEVSGEEEAEELSALSKLTSYLPSTSFQQRPREVRIISLEDVRRRYQLLLAQLELVSLYPNESSAIMTSTTSDAISAVLFYVRSQNYEHAFTLAHNAHVDRTQVYTSLTDKCLELVRWEEVQRQWNTEQDGQAEHPLMQAYLDDQDDVRSPDVDGYGATSALSDQQGWHGGEIVSAPSAKFLEQSDRCVSWKGSTGERAWRYLRLWLSFESGAGRETDEVGSRTGYGLVVLNRILGRRLWRLTPTWLTEWFRKHESEALIRTLMRHDHILPALQEALQLVRASTVHVTASVKRRRVGGAIASRTYLPYLLIDILLKLAEDPTNTTMSTNDEANGVVKVPSTLEIRQTASMLREAVEKHKERLNSLERELRRNLGEDEARARRSNAIQAQKAQDMEMGE